MKHGARLTSRVVERALVLAGLITAGMASRASALPAGFVVDNPFPTVTFTFPTQIAFLPDGRRLVAEKEGKVWVITPAGTRVASPFVDLSARVLSTGDRGLLGIALDPDWAQNRWIYFLYTADPDSDGVDVEFETWSRLERYRSGASDSNHIDLSTRQVLIGRAWPDGIPAPDRDQTHVIGTLRFGSDKTLFVGSGDAAHYDGVDHGGRDPNAFGPGRSDPSQDIGAFRAQSLNSLCGKILRVDKETGLGLPSNPYWNGDPAAARSRVWVYGVRNPYRFAVRPGSGSTNPAEARPGTLYIADVGWGTWEELDIVAGGGLNLGWPCIEGPAANGPYLQGPQPPGVGCPSIGGVDNPTEPTGPNLYWHHTLPASSSPPGAVARAIVAGAYYTGSSYPLAYRNKLFIGDFVTGWLRVVDLDASDHVLGLDDFMPSGAGNMGDIETDPATGDVWWVGTYDGRIRRLRYLTGNHDPYAVATVSPLYGPAPLAVSVNASASTDADMDVLGYLWRFGDGDSATTDAASHTYANDGVYTIDLEVSDGHGGTDRRQFEVVVGQVPPPGHIVLPLTGEFHVSGDLVTLRAVAVDTTAGPASYRWDVDLGHDTHHHLSEQVLFGPEAQYVFTLHEDNERYFNRIRLTVTQGPFTVHDTAEVFPRRNLRVESLATRPRSPAAHESVTVSVLVRSLGGVGSHTTRMLLRDGATTWIDEPLDPIAGDDSLVVVRKLPPLPAGRHVLRFEVDPDGTMNETDETDDTTSVALVVRTPGEPFAVWRADSASGSGPPVVPGAGGPWRESVNALDGVLTGFGGVTDGWRADAGAGEPWRLSFDGQDDRVALAAPGAFAPFETPSGTTAELWVRPGADVTRRQTVLEWLETVADPAPGLSLVIENGRWLVNLSPLRDAGEVAPHRWVHVVVSQSNDSARVWLNGVRTLTEAFGNRGSQRTEARLGASVRGAAVTEAFAGEVGEVRLYDVALNGAAAGAAFARDEFHYRAASAPPLRVLAWSADSATGLIPYAEGSVLSPWRSLAPGAADAHLVGFASASDSSGWRGNGLATSPWRLEFDGLDDRAEVPQDRLAALAGAESLTVSLWFRAGDALRAQTVLEWASSSGEPHAGLGVGLAAGSLRVHAGEWRTCAPATSGAWHHVVAAVVPAATRVWLDGLRVWTANRSDAGTPVLPLVLGASPSAGGFTDPFRGAIARAEIWRGAFDDAGVSALYSSQRGPFEHRIEPTIPGPLRVSAGNPCREVPYRFARADSTPLRGFSVTLRLGGDLVLCGPIVPGSACDAAPTAFQVRDLGGGDYAVDAAVLGSTCLSGVGDLFRVPVTSAGPDGVSQLRVLSARVRDPANHVLAADPGAALDVVTDHLPPAAPGPIQLQPVREAAGPTLALRPVFQVPADAESVRVLRAPYGHAPEYDDGPGAGSVPPAPTWPPQPPWQATPVDWSGRLDRPGTRDCWSYAAFAWDSSGNRSPASVTPTCTVDYRLADTHDGQTACAGDGGVDAADLQHLLLHYGELLGPNDSRGCLDFGPTLARAPFARPLTDDQLDFEDLMVLALDWDAAVPFVAPTPVPDHLLVQVPLMPAVGDTFRVGVLFEGGGRVHGLNLRMFADSLKAVPIGVQPGPLLAQQVLSGRLASSRAGGVDAVLLGRGPGFTGSGIIAWLVYRRIAGGDPQIGLISIAGRDSANANVSVASDQIITGAPEASPAELALSTGVPNPSRGPVAFTVALPAPGPAELTLFDVQGRRVRTLLSGLQAPGVQRLSWDGRDAAGHAAAPGVYLARLRVGSTERVRSVVRLR